MQVVRCPESRTEHEFSDVAFSVKRSLYSPLSPSTPPVPEYGPDRWKFKMIFYLVT